MISKIAAKLYSALGWKFEGELPDDLRSFVYLGAPHTSNHDVFPAMVVGQHLKRNCKFVIKSEWTKFPFGLILKPAGAIGLDRGNLKEKNRESTIDIMARMFKEHKDLVLLIAPEGTRKPVDKWKTGFYYIAQKAGVPIVCGFGDYEKKTFGIGPIIYPTNFEEDMKKIMEFYASIHPKNPENFKLHKL